MGVDVDEPGCDHEAVGVDLPCAPLVELSPDSSDRVGGDGDVPVRRGRSGPVDDGGVADHEVGHPSIVARRAAASVTGRTRGVKAMLIYESLTGNTREAGWTSSA